MKEMTIEQKAEAYDEAIKQIKECTPDENGFVTIYPNEIFPELKENENGNERIRKILIAQMERWHEIALENNVVQDIKDSANAITWLEKQGEQKSYNNKFTPEQASVLDKHIDKFLEQKPTNKVEPKFKVKYAGSEYNVFETKDIAGVTFYGIEDEPNHIDYVLPDNCEIIFEQKPADKIEPKFHEGEWMVFNDKHKSVYQIEKIENFQYTLRHFLGGSMPLSFSSENMLRPWTIQDAMDGDVLTCDGKHGQEIGIAKKYIGKYGGCDICFETYCFVDWDDIFRVGEYMGSRNIHPATKEQRDTLMKAMTNAGYIFDFEKKKLKKIEPKPTEWSGDEQKQDVSIQINSSDYINVSAKCHEAVEYDKKYPQNQWKPSDEQMKALYAARHGNYFDVHTLESLFYDLEQLK